MEQASYSEYDEGDFEEDCSVIPPDYRKFLLIGVIGMPIAVLSVILNTFLFIVFVKNPYYRSSNRIYLTFLALADTILSVAYILTSPVNVYMDYYESEILAFVWWRSMRFSLTVANVFFLVSAYIIIAAAFEGLVTIYKMPIRFTESGRYIIFGAALLIACTAKLPKYFEYEVIPNGNCTGVTEFLATFPEFSLKEPYSTVYKHWYRDTVAVFLPFLIVVLLNVALLVALFQHQEDVSQEQKNIRSETLILFFLTLTFIVSNIIDVAMTIWELVDTVALFSEEVDQLHTLLTESIAISFLIASCLRLPIYIACSPRIRQDVLGFKPCQVEHRH